MDGNVRVLKDKSLLLNSEINVSVSLIRLKLLQRI